MDPTDLLTTNLPTTILPTTLDIQIDQTIQLFIFLIFCGVFLTLANDLLNLLAWIMRKIRS